MTTHEAARLHLYERAREAMDDDAATTLVSHLPWNVADLATKQDVWLLKEDVRHLKDRFTMLDERFATMEERLTARIESATGTMFVRMVIAMVSCNATIAALVAVGAQLAGR